MNNEQFRRLIPSNATKSTTAQNEGSRPNSHSASGTPLALGSRLKSSIPMTPRSVAGGARVDFAKQLAERNQAFEKTQKKVKPSTPRGSKLPQGYVDRAKARLEEENDERAKRLQALEEAVKKEEIDPETYERLRNEIAGGDLSSTHLVKGLDFKLLERIRRGENVFNEKTEPPAAEEEEQPQEVPEEDPDDALEQLESTEVKAITREKVQKKGQLATTALNPGHKRTRNQILAEWKAAKAAAKAKEESSLGLKFRKIGAKREPGMRIERDSKGREVMIIVDEDGHERRKVRKVGHGSIEDQEKEVVALASGRVLGMEVPEFYRKQQEEKKAEEDGKEVNIFDDAGSDYDPLADLEGSDAPSDEEEGETRDGPVGETGSRDAPSTMMPPPPKRDTPAARNYFSDSKRTLTSAETYNAPSLDDAAFLAALRKAKAASAVEKSEEEQKAAEREERLKKKLSEVRRDEADLDMGFGSSRMEDEAEMDETKVKLSAWGEDDDDEGDGGGGGGGGTSKRKRGSRKKKGDKNNFEDVMRVMKRNKGSG